MRVLYGNGGECEAMRIESVSASGAVGTTPGTHGPLASRDLQSTPVLASVQGNTKSVQPGAGK